MGKSLRLTIGEDAESTKKALRNLSAAPEFNGLVEFWSITLECQGRFRPFDIG